MNSRTGAESFMLIPATAADAGVERLTLGAVDRAAGGGVGAQHHAADYVRLGDRGESPAHGVGHAPQW